MFVVKKSPKWVAYPVQSQWKNSSVLLPSDMNYETLCDPIEMHADARPQKKNNLQNEPDLSLSDVLLSCEIQFHHTCFFPLCRIRGKKKIATSTMEMGILHEKNSTMCLKCGNKQNQRRKCDDLVEDARTDTRTE